ncbi:MAG: hypothetical protein GY898_06225 [Proteobacteria bacterium]|nr:hypothetical protein [Pseudomonadota bacterium]
MPLRLLITLFFLLSGATALVYQVIWVRMLGLVVGHSALAVATVVATYMAGLGLGARLAGGRATKLEHPLAAYGAMEVAIGAFALASPWLLGAGALAGGGAFLSLGVSALVLLLPTVAMGATLPLITHWYARDDASLGRDMGWLYAINTTGAVVGAGLAGFVLLPSLGQPTALALAAGVNLAVGALAIGVGRRFPLAPFEAPAAAPAAESPAPALSPAATTAVLAAFALSGAAALTNQVAWNRAFVLLTGSTTYAFSLIVCAFIAGLALGGHVFARVVDRVDDRVRLLGGLNIAIAAAAAILIPLIGELPLLLIEPLAERSGSFARSQELVFGVLFALVVAPTFLMGATYPVATRALAGRADEAAEAVGRAYAWNTVGGVLGALGCGLVLLPWLGIRNTLWLAGGLNLVAAAVLLGPRHRLALVLPVLAVAGAVGSPGWNPRHMNLAPHMYAQDLVNDANYLAEIRDSGSLLFHEEGVSATVSVLQRSSGARVLRINGKTDASTERDRLYQGLVGTLPLLLAQERGSMFMLGLGSGMSLASALDQPLDRVTIVELLPEVVRGAEHLGPLLGEPLKDPRTRLVIADGRHHLRTTDQTFDVISSNPTNLFVSGMSTLFTVEAFEEMRGALAPGGTALVWVQGYLLGREDFATIARTFQSVFPEAHLWSGGNFDFYLVAQQAPLSLDGDELARRIDGLVGTESAAWTALKEPLDLQRHYLLGPDALRALAGDGRLHHDADPFLEFSTLRALYGGEDLLDCQALTALREPLPLDAPEGAVDARLEAVRTIDDATFDGGLQPLRQALAGDRKHPAGREQLARLLHAEAIATASAGDLGRAEEHLRLLLSFEPLALTSWRLLAAIEQADGRPHHAVQTLRTARDGQPWNPYAHLALAQLLDSLDKTDEADAAWAEVRRLDPELPELSATLPQ